MQQKRIELSAQSMDWGLCPLVFPGSLYWYLAALESTIQFNIMELAVTYQHSISICSELDEVIKLFWFGWLFVCHRPVHLLLCVFRPPVLCWGYMHCINTSHSWNQLIPNSRTSALMAYIFDTCGIYPPKFHCYSTAHLITVIICSLRLGLLNMFEMNLADTAVLYVNLWYIN